MQNDITIFDRDNLTEFVLTSYSDRDYGLPKNLLEADRQKFAVKPMGAQYECMIRRYQDICAVDRGYLLNKRWRLINDFPGSLDADEKRASFLWQARRKRLFAFNKKRWVHAFWPSKLLFTDIFYWLSNMLPALYLLRKHRIELPVILPARHKNSPRDMQSLEAFKDLDIEFLEPRTLGLFNNVWTHDPISFSRHGHRVYNAEALAETAGYLKDFFSSTTEKGPKRVYISRQKSRRRLANADEIEPVIKRAGFTEIFLEDLDFRGQIQALGNAEAMISVHGAGMGNMLFQPGGATIIELTKPGIHGFFSGLSDAMGHDYYYLNGTGAEGKNSDIHIDRNSLEKLLGEIRLL
ncbi:MAG: glycosyltransferase 61 family protein [Pseudomonadota bacterium]